MAPARARARDASSRAEVKGRGASASAAEESAILQAIYELETSEAGTPRPAESAAIEGAWRLLYSSKSKWDPANPLGRRVDGSAPGLEGLFRGLFGARCCHRRPR